MPGKRRGSGEGAIYQRKSDRRWVSAVDLGHVGGRRRRKVVYGRTRKEVAEKLKDLHRQQQQGMLQGTDKTTVGGYLLDWLERAGTKRRDTTIEVYGRILNNHIIPHIGKIQLGKLTSDDINAMIAAVVAEGHPSTARQARQILNRAFKDAIRRTPPLLLVNPVGGTDPPKVEPAPPHTLNDDEAQRLLHAAEGERFGIAIKLGLLHGLRRGEITGLQWGDIDWQAKTLSIQRTARRVGRTRGTTPPKTKAGIRVLPLVAGLADDLAAHRAAQEEEFALRGIENTGDLIVASQTATMYDTANYLLAFRRIVKKAGLPETLRPHDLRHSTASLLIAHGVDPRTAASVLGHSSAQITLDIYTRGLQTDKRQALEGLGQRLRAKKKRT